MEEKSIAEITPEDWGLLEAERKRRSARAKRKVRMAEVVNDLLMHLMPASEETRWAVENYQPAASDPHFEIVVTDSPEPGCATFGAILSELIHEHLVVQ